MSRLLFQTMMLASCCLALPLLAAPDDFHLLQQQISAARLQGDMAQADQLATRYLNLANAEADPLQQGLAQYQLGCNAMERNIYPTARQHLETAISLLQPGGQTKPLADALHRLGMLYRYQSNYAKALEYVYQAMQIYQTLEDTSSIAATYSSIGVILEKMGQYTEALQAHQQGLILHHQLKDQSSIASAIYNLGDLNRSLGDTSKALAYFLQALEMDIASGDARNIAYSHNKLGYLYSDLAEFDKAAMHAQQALALFEQIGARRDIDWARTVLAKLAMEQGDYTQAQQLLEGVIARAQQHSYNSLLVDAYHMAAELAMRQADDTAALAYISAGIAMAQQNHERADEAKLRQMQVDIYLRQDAVHEALNALLQQKQLEDEIFSSKRAATIASIQAQTDFTRQQHQIALLEKEQTLQSARLQQQRLIRNFWILGLVAVFALLLSLYRRHLQQRQNRRLEQQVAARTQELRQKNQELELAYQQLETISLTDKLTGLNNRRFLESHIHSELEQCRRVQFDWQTGKTARPDNAELALFLIDLDHFKALNDNYGHDVGDYVLRQLRHIMQRVFRHSDYLVRWGGEEFIAIARGINRDEVGHLAQRFVAAVQQSAINVDGYGPLNITCSLGYVCYPLPLRAADKHWPVLLKLADICLYAAKSSGRNGWVGLHNLSAELTVNESTLSAEQLQAWHEQNLLQLQHSFNQPLSWQATADRSR